jgi:hypothetical protein
MPAFTGSDEDQELRDDGVEADDNVEMPGQLASISIHSYEALSPVRMEDAGESLYQAPQFCWNWSKFMVISQLLLIRDFRRRFPLVCFVYSLRFHCPTKRCNRRLRTRTST